MMVPLILIALAIIAGAVYYFYFMKDDAATETRNFGAPPGLLALERPKNRFGGEREHRGMNPDAVQSLMRPTKFGARPDVSAQLGDIKGMPNSLVNLGFPKIEKRNMIGPMSSTPY